MSIQEEIFESFFTKLEEERSIPSSVIQELKDAWQGGENMSEEKVLRIIERGCKNA